MRHAIEFRPTRGLERLLLALSIPVLALGAGTALAASNVLVDCDARQGVAEPGALNISTVDLKPHRDGEEDRDDLRVDDDASAAPVLRLGARVATIVRGVFGDDASTPAAATGTGIETARVPLGTTMPPLAGSREPVADPPVDEPVQDDLQPYSPIEVHREMYRTDI